MADRRASLGRVQVYLGRCRADEVIANRERFGGVTLQGLHGLGVAARLARVGELRGVDLDPAAYLARGKARPPVVEGQLGLDLDLPVFDWVTAQAELGLPVVRTAGQRLRVGQLDELKAELHRDYPVPVSVTLVLDGGWLGSKHSGVLAEQLRAADRDVSLVLGAPFDPVDSSYKVHGLQRVLRWSARTGRKLELLRTGPIGIPAIAAGAKVAAIGLSTSTRHLGGPVARRADGVRPRRSPQVFVPRLLHWQRGVDLKGTEVTHCGCPACARTGKGLSRFDVSFDSAVPAAVRSAAQEHDSHALADLVRSVMTASDPKDRLAQLRAEAQELAGALGMPVPRWLGSWD
jgi:mRNA-degrading endonuclease toxin of MazEF toxin-antitoxin module